MVQSYDDYYDNTTEALSLDLIKGWGEAGFPKWGQTGGGDNLGKMAKNCMKITKSTFLGQNSGGQANFSGSGGIPPVPPLGKTLGGGVTLSPFIVPR